MCVRVLLWRVWVYTLSCILCHQLPQTKPTPIILGCNKVLHSTSSSRVNFWCAISDIGGGDRPRGFAKRGESCGERWWLNLSLEEDSKRAVSGLVLGELFNWAVIILHTCTCGPRARESARKIMPSRTPDVAGDEDEYDGESATSTRDGAQFLPRKRREKRGESPPLVMHRTQQLTPL